MVAVLTVFADHLFHWPRGGFIGVDVFFVISGFLITGNLLRTAQNTGTVSFKNFYWNRVRRIVPAATVVLVVTYVACLLVFLPFRAQQVGIDALFAFIFMANWHFAFQDTDYFAAADAVSPIQHYWSLSIEEQFYFVWPALIFAISFVVVRKAWTHRHRMLLAGMLMGGIVLASLGWAVYETAAAPAWAYFNTFARIWELGVGALLATAVGITARIPVRVKPLLSWCGLGLIAASVFLISDSSVGFPAPWALLPVVGAALVIAAGVGEEPQYQHFLRNRVSTYIGDISYSLYLVHWPVIVILAAMMRPGVSFYITVVALSFGLAIASYHFVENPLRRADSQKFRDVLHQVRRRRYEPQRSSGYAALGSVALVVVALAAYAVRSDAYDQSTPPPIAAISPTAPNTADLAQPLGPLASGLQAEIAEALKATEWPQLDPTMEAVVSDIAVRTELQGCHGTEPLTDPASCAWGSPSAPTRVVVVGDSIAANFVVPFREIALNSGGRIHVYTLAMGGCEFVNDQIYTDDESRLNACPARKQAAVDYINSYRPEVVIITNNYLDQRVNGTNEAMSEGAWSASMRTLVDKFRGSVAKLVFLAPPSGNAPISECYSKRGSTPADCIGVETGKWLRMVAVSTRSGTTMTA